MFLNPNEFVSLRILLHLKNTGNMETLSTESGPGSFPTLKYIIYCYVAVDRFAACRETV